MRWSGRPQQGIVFRGTDLFLIPFSLFWCGFAIYWESAALSGGSQFMILWGVPFVAAGLFIVFGRFFFDAFIRSKTRYALTDHRALILGGVNGAKLTAVDLRTVSEIRFSGAGGSAGTISFGPNPRPFSGAMWLSTSSTAPEFFRAENAATAYKLIQAAKAPRP